MQQTLLPQKSPSTTLPSPKYSHRCVSFKSGMLIQFHVGAEKRAGPMRSSEDKGGSERSTAVLNRTARPQDG